MKKSILSLAIFLAAQFALAAITILTPRDGAVVSAIPESLREYLAFDAQKRASIMLDAEYRKAIAKTARHPAAIYFRWNADSGENFVVELSETKNFDAPIAVPAGKSSRTPKQFRSRVYNLKIAQNYFWRIKNTDTGEVTKTRMITVSDASPRIMNISGVLNVRDLGGRVGLDNRRVKQNLIFRGRGLNNNSKDGKTAGKNMITADGIKYMTDVLKIKTDIDLRSPREVADMAGSPLGDGVKWINISSTAYGGIFTDKGKANYAKLFRLFCDEKNYPIYVHCIAGADRTGTICYLLNAVLGVNDDLLEKDWEITICANTSVGFSWDKRFSKILAGIEKFGTKEEPTVVKVERYLKSAGITDEEIAKFRGIMLQN